MPSRLRLPSLPALAEGGALFLLVAALLAIQVLIGGTRMIFSLPPYLLVSVAGLLALLSLRAAKPAADRACLTAFVVFVVYVLVRAAFSPAPYIVRSDVYSALAALVVYLLVALVLTGASQRLLLVGCLLLFALAHVLVGAWQFRDGNNFMPISWLQRYDYGTRASGFYVCPNHLAGLLEALGAIGLSIVAWSRWPIWTKLLVGYVVVCCYAGVIITGSRGGYVSAGMGLLVFALLSLVVLRRVGRGLFWKIGGLGALAAFLLLAIAGFAVAKNQYLSGRAQTVVDTENIRFQLWQAALEQWHLQPLVGTGTGTYLYFGRLFRAATMQRDPVYAHGDYVHLLAEYGALGAAAVAVALWLHFRSGLRTFGKMGPKRVAVSQRVLSNALALNIGALAALSTCLVHSALDFNLHIPANALLMSLFLGLLANDGVVRLREEEKLPPRGTIAWRLVAPAASLLLLVQIARLLPGEYFAERARGAVRDQQPAVALHEAARGLRYDPRNPDLHSYLGQARLQLGDGMEHPRAAAAFYQDAVENFARAHALAPQNEVYGLELASTLDSVGRYPEAEAIYQQTLQLDPRSESLRQAYEGHLQSWQGVPAKAIESGDKS